MPDIAGIGANWVSVCPFGIMDKNSTDVIFNSTINWFGDRDQGLKKSIAQANRSGLKVCLKPQLYVKGMGWPGDYNPGKILWPVWEENYTKYILFLAEIAEQEDVDMLMVGTECKSSIRLRPEYWTFLIDTVRSVYSGQLSYASNWDNYNNIPFWNQLDVISIDAYFPLRKEKTPDTESIEIAWKPIIKKLDEFAKKYNKTILFSEYGYRSTDNTAWQQWLIESRPVDEKINLQAQLNAYQGFYSAIWNRPWFAGGFIWKWYCLPNSGGIENSDYTPQGKPVLSEIEKIYKQ